MTKLNRNAAAMLALLSRSSHTGVELVHAGIFGPPATADYLERKGWRILRTGAGPSALTTRYTLVGGQQELGAVERVASEQLDGESG